MKCRKCIQPAVVHLTDIVTKPDGRKQSVEIHLCLSHAIDAGFVAPNVGQPKLPSDSESNPPAEIPEGIELPPDSPPPTAIVPILPIPPGGLAVIRKDAPPPLDPDACPICGATYPEFKAAGLLGCPHDYEFFQARLLPLIKRAQEGSAQHAGKVPTPIRQTDRARVITAARLRRELDHALQAENYEQAAQLRDQLRQLDVN